MRVYLGKSGLQESFQDEFAETTKCHKCHRKAKIMFVVSEFEVAKNHVADLYETTGIKGGLWVHDAIACASYLCPWCFEVTSILNQA